MSATVILHILRNPTGKIYRIAISYEGFKTVMQNVLDGDLLETHVFTSKREADAYMHKLTSEARKSVKGKHLPIVCVTTSETFTSANAACNAHNLNNSDLSEHLNYPLIYPSVQGRIYKREE